SISAFALHPLYLNLQAVAGKHSADIIKSFNKKQKQLNDLSEIDYEQVIKFKISIAKELFESKKEKLLNDDSFKAFIEENRHCLIPYAACCYLSHRNSTADFRKWKLYGVYNREAIEKYVAPKAKHYNEIAFNYFLQFHLHLQLKDAVEYAHKIGVII